MLKLENINKSFDKNRVLKDINLEINESETLGIVGESGSGKTTLVRIMLRLIEPDSGMIIYDDKDITQLKNRELMSFRKNYQIISQRPESSFDPSKKIIKSLIGPLKNFKMYNADKFSLEIDIKLNELKLSRDLLERYPHQLSGGEIQRLSIIRSMLLNPRILILDESTSMLDISVQAQILNLLQDLRKKEKINYIVISHDKDIIKFLCDKYIEISDGKIL